MKNLVDLLTGHVFNRNIKGGVFYTLPSETTIKLKNGEYGKVIGGTFLEIDTNTLFDITSVDMRKTDRLEDMKALLNLRAVLDRTAYMVK